MQQLEVISLADDSALVNRIITDLTNQVETLLASQNQINISLTGGRIGLLNQ
jgi:hypothetical protein